MNNNTFAKPQQNRFSPIRSLVALVLASITLAAQAAPSFSANGAEVTDSVNKLIWQRCPVGMTFDSASTNCTGSHSTMTHEAALQYAKANAGTVGWRLPTVNELATLVDRTRNSPAINTTFFPNSPSAIFWTSSNVSGDASSARLVDFNIGGGVYYNVRSSSFAVRLVRASQ